jgi:hypothetical protein
MEPDWKSLFAELLLAYEACVDDLETFGVFTPIAFDEIHRKHVMLVASYKHTLEENDVL